jgi:hypothetical protein
MFSLFSIRFWRTDIYIKLNFLNKYLYNINMAIEVTDAFLAWNCIVSKLLGVKAYTVSVKMFSSVPERYVREYITFSYPMKSADSLDTSERPEWISTWKGPFKDVYDAAEKERWVTFRQFFSWRIS